MAKLPEVIRACLTNPALKAKLMADPKAVLAEHGIKVPPGFTVTVVENTPSVFHLVLPKTDVSSELSDEELAAAAGGWGDPMNDMLSAWGYDCD